MWFRRVPAGSDGVVELGITDRFDGDFRVDQDGQQLDELRSRVFSGAWTWLRQVHGAEVVTVAAAGDGAGCEADGAVTVVPGAVLAVHTADCVPVVLIGDRVVSVVHAGWRGLVAGVVGEAVDQIRLLRPTTNLRAILGPCIRPSHYEFGAAELQMVEETLGGSVAGTTAAGGRALDMPAAVTKALAHAGVTTVDDLGFDTADERWFSHRLRGDQGRQVTAVRLVDQ